ncbi:hypothetical protein PHYSODRAFT_261285 [Phytophthora sojae]|uniref:Uncharacterized protein n=1 Tax=Phytophthora sojae (strain P6497) TaxID=1094619 RepID=G4YYK3_PHYSP|nr:hypothetical protein PHYSODRAFT_261285 [Phytophthora sojae]EGZ25121.1 hypothetical protein PHYSODRAFT_261285 [Phytophthora sojae]|eukprot:XP_009520409.1 hypothetical protein PHYSODRAFT_261285 [Phytophthora sojae]
MTSAKRRGQGHGGCRARGSARAHRERPERAAAFEALEQMLALQSEQTDRTFKVFKCIVKLAVAVVAALVVAAALGQRRVGRGGLRKAAVLATTRRGLRR